MSNSFDSYLNDTAERALAGLALDTPSERAACFHCGEPCRDNTYAEAEMVFCCHGCQVVHDLLAENGLEQFYDLSVHPGLRIRQARGQSREHWAYLDAPELQQRLLDFTDGKVSRITFHIPGIHCIACVWLLENLYRLNSGIGGSQVNFPKRQVSIAFNPAALRLSELVHLLASIGYEPQLTLNELENHQPDPSRKQRWLRLGIAGFAFGNIMLFSLPLYLGLDSLSGPLFKTLFGCLSLALAAPVVTYSASDYWRSAWLSARRRTLTLDVPIVLGLAALYAQSAVEILSGRGGGYLDSLAGLVFFLLCGRSFQQKTFERMAFDRDYKCFFPLAVTRRSAAGEESVAISNLRVGDRIILRNRELIPADSRLLVDQASIDYSFVTGESEPVAKHSGDYLYAGGQQLGGAIELGIVKPVSQGYLTSLWNHETFQKERATDLNTLTNRYSRRFTFIVVAVALGAALFWMLSGDTLRGLKAFTSVLIVACPCALALAAPFTLGTAQRLLARLQVFLKNGLVLERMAQVNAVIFDKTGTLTSANTSDVTFYPASKVQGPKSKLPPNTDVRGLDTLEASWVASLARQSTHPHSMRIAEALGTQAPLQLVKCFVETAGCGIAGNVDGHSLCLGSRTWQTENGIEIPEASLPPGSAVLLALDGEFRGVFILTNALRPETGELIAQLRGRYELALLSGDNAMERERFQTLFANRSQTHSSSSPLSRLAAHAEPTFTAEADGAAASALRFNQSPLDKLDFIRTLQASGKVVMMVGDGLNDAGALRQSDVGVAVVEKLGAFSPASDVIVAAGQVPRLAQILTLASRTTRIVRLSFGISAVYNLLGIGIAAAGILSPLICAILMPLSSISVVLFACGATHLEARRLGLTQGNP